MRGTSTKIALDSHAQLMMLIPLALLLLATATATAHASASATEATAHASALLVRVLSVTFILWLSTWAFCLQIYTQQKASGSPMGPLYKLVSCQRETYIDTIPNLRGSEEPWGCTASGHSLFMNKNNNNHENNDNE